MAWLSPATAWLSSVTEPTKARLPSAMSRLAFRGDGVAALGDGLASPRHDLRALRAHLAALHGGKAVVLRHWQWLPQPPKTSQHAARLEEMTCESIPPRAWAHGSKRSQATSSSTMATTLKPIANLMCSGMRANTSCAKL
eukprot:15460403-Alexandrium_andersonii.AAC.1